MFTNCDVGYDCDCNDLYERPCPSVLQAFMSSSAFSLKSAAACQQVFQESICLAICFTQGYIPCALNNTFTRDSYCTFLALTRLPLGSMHVFGMDEYCKTQFHLAKCCSYLNMWDFIVI